MNTSRIFSNRKSQPPLGLRRVITARKKDGTVFSAELAVSETVIGEQRMFTGLIRSLIEKEENKCEVVQILSLWQSLEVRQESLLKPVINFLIVIKRTR